MLLWMVGAVIGGWLLPKRWQASWLVTCTCTFLFVYSINSLFVMLAITLLLGLATVQFKGSQLAIGCTVAACFLSLLSYRVISDFSATDNNALLLGFAFYILRAIHFLLDVYRNRIKAVSWGKLIQWFWFLPTLQVGPIHRFDTFARDIERRRWNSDFFNQGLQRILFGYIKLVLFGNYLIAGKFTVLINTLDHQSWLFNYLDTLRYGLLLYFRFAGYSDIAIGFALLLGFRVMENFNKPFLATNLVDFWKRWHISLSSWCRDYVYTPVLAITRIPIIAALASMMILGIWHEISWRYCLWGLLHGVGIAICQRWQRTKTAKSFETNKVWSITSLFATQHFVLLSFTLTGLNTMDKTLLRLSILFGIT